MYEPHQKNDANLQTLFLPLAFHMAEYPCPKFQRGKKIINTTNIAESSSEKHEEKTQRLSYTVKCQQKNL